MNRRIGRFRPTLARRLAVVAGLLAAVSLPAPASAVFEPPAFAAVAGTECANQLPRGFHLPCIDVAGGTLLVAEGTGAIWCSAAGTGLERVTVYCYTPGGDNATQASPFPSANAVGPAFHEPSAYHATICVRAWGDGPLGPYETRTWCGLGFQP